MWQNLPTAMKGGTEMAGQRQPTHLVVAKGKKHFSKEELADRLAREVQPCTDGIEAPGYLTAKQKKQFDKIAGQLKKIKIMGETDVDALARYITAQDLYEDAVKELRRLKKERPKDPDEENYYIRMELWHKSQDLADKRQDRLFKQAQAAARDLGLTISSRCKLQVPEPAEEAPKADKFSRFAAVKAVGSE